MEKLDAQHFIDLLKQLIETPSLSREENNTADLLADFLQQYGCKVQRKKHNVWAKNRDFHTQKPTILLNSHHDTVKPITSYTLDPYTAIEKGGKLFGLGSNDAGGALVSLIATFLHFYEEKDLPFNLIIAATAEEEISGVNGIAHILPDLPAIDLAIVGEPTEMQMAIAEKGLLVIDAYAKGQGGHAARQEGKNAIYEALTDIAWIKSYQFPKKSEWLGPVLMQVTQIEAGTQHNVVPDACHFVIDVRATDAYSLEETLAIIDKHTYSELKPRSVRLQPSHIAETHLFVQGGKSLGLQSYGSPTLSDQALIPYTSIKIGPGKSERSHTADEYIYTEEIKEGIKTYIQLLETYRHTIQ